MDLWERNGYHLLAHKLSMSFYLALQVISGHKRKKARDCYQSGDFHIDRGNIAMVVTNVRRARTAPLKKHEFGCLEGLFIN